MSIVNSFSPFLGGGGGSSSRLTTATLIEQKSGSPTSSSPLTFNTLMSEDKIYVVSGSYSNVSGSNLGHLIGVVVHGNPVSVNPGTVLKVGVSGDKIQVQSTNASNSSTKYYDLVEIS